MFKVFMVSSLLSLSLSNLAQGNDMSYSSKDIGVLMRSDIIEGSVKIASAEDTTKAWYCVSPCYQVTIEFQVRQPQTNYRFAGLANVGQPDSTGRTYNYEVMTAKLNLGALTSSFNEIVKVVLPEAILPLKKGMESITLNGQKYNFFLKKENGSLELR